MDYCGLYDHLAAMDWFSMVLRREMILVKFKHWESLWVDNLVSFIWEDYFTARKHTRNRNC